MYNLGRHFTIFALNHQIDVFPPVFVTYSYRLVSLVENTAISPIKTLVGAVCFPHLYISGTLI